MSNVESQIELIKTLVSSIGTRTAALSPEQMALQSACSEWQVQDVVGHLIGGAQRQIDSMTRGRTGDSGPPEGFVPMPSTATSASNSQRDVQQRVELGDRLLAAYNEHYARLYEVMDTFHPDGWESLCWHMRRYCSTLKLLPIDNPPKV